MVRYLEYANSQEAWEGLNEYFLNNEAEILKLGCRNGSQLIAFDNMIKIRKAWVDPQMDFGNTFGYRMQKWTGLINNYVDLNYLDLLKSQILAKENAKGAYKNYNISMQFDNSHGHGKNCLLSLTFSRTQETDIPIATFHLRSSEITKRLLLDLLLVQRIAEYIYGVEQHIMIKMLCTNMYQSAESFVMYNIHKDISSVLKIKKEKTNWQERVLKTLKEFSTIDASKVTYKVFLRSVNQLQGLKGDHPMLAKDLPLFKKDIEYPEDCITMSQRKKYKREYNKKLKADGKN